jgi:hypothetical protein
MNHGFIGNGGKMLIRAYHPRFVAPAVVALTLVFATAAAGASAKAEKFRPRSGAAERGSLADVHSLTNPQPTDIQRDGASFIALHFRSLHLEAGDSLVVAAVPAGVEAPVVYEGPLDKSDKWGQPIAAAHLSLVLKDTSGHAAYEIREFSSGFGPPELHKRNANGTTGGLVENCGADDSRPAVCFKTTQPAAYRASNAVVRLITMVPAAAPAGSWEMVATF